MHGVLLPRSLRSAAATLACVTMLLGILAAPAAADQTHRLIVSGNGDASDDPSYPITTHAFATGTSSSLVNPSTPDAVYTSGDGFAFQYGTFPPSKAGLLWFDVSGVPQGRRIVRATLHLKTWWAGLNPDPARPDSVFACADTIASDTRWTGANLATWSEPREGQSGPWSPALADRTTYRQFGIVSRPRTTPVPIGLNSPGGGWWELDVTRGVQAWVNGAPNAGFWIFGRAWYNKNGSLYWSQANNAALRPWLEIHWSDEPDTGPWQGGKDVAFSFSTDDGFRFDNLLWAEVLDSLGYHFTACVVDSFIANSPAGAGEKLHDADLASLAARGHEVGGHSTAHREWNPAVVADAVVAWGVDRQAIAQHLPSGYEVETLAWPFHLHDTRMTEIARDAGYLVGRNGGIGWSQYKAGSYCSWDSCRIYEVGLTCEGSRITSNEAATRAYIRESVREAVEHGNGWINLYAHTADGRYDGVDITRQEMIWVIDELVNTGRVWIGTMGEVARYYRQYHSPAPWDPMMWVLDAHLVAVDEPPAAAGARLQNRPNPFNARTAFAFSLRSPGRARLEVYDLAGHLVAVPVDADLPAGSHESIWDGRDRLGRNLGSGQYVYRLKSPDGVATSRLLLVK